MQETKSSTWLELKAIKHASESMKKLLRKNT